MQKRLKLKVKGQGVFQETRVDAQVKMGFFWETIASIPVAGSRNTAEAVRMAKAKLEAFLSVGFDDNGVIQL